jgi:hypothetical protein
MEIAYDNLHCRGQYPFIINDFSVTRLIQPSGRPLLTLKMTDRARVFASAEI